MRKIFDYENDDMMNTTNTTIKEDYEMRDITAEYANKGIDIGDCQIFEINDDRRMIEYGMWMTMGITSELLDRACELARRKNTTLQAILEDDGEEYAKDDTEDDTMDDNHDEENMQMVIDLYEDFDPEIAERIRTSLVPEQFRYVDAFDWEMDGIWFEHDRYNIPLDIAANIILDPICIELHDDIANRIWDNEVPNPHQNPFDYETVKDNVR